MSNIKYNEEQEAYELPYKMWNKAMTVRFYADSEEDIMSNISAIAMKLETLNGGRKNLAQLIVDEGYYEGDVEPLLKSLALVSVYVDMDDEEITVCFTVNSDDGYLNELNGEIYEDEFELIGWN